MDDFDVLSNDAKALSQRYRECAKDLVQVVRTSYAQGYSEHQTRALLYLSGIPKDLADGAIVEVTETTLPPVSAREPAIYLGPQEIRDHFEGDDDELSRAVEKATYDELLDVGRDALGDDRFWVAFHDVLVDVVRERLIEPANTESPPLTQAQRDAYIDSGMDEDRFRREILKQELPYPESPLGSRRVLPD